MKTNLFMLTVLIVATIAAAGCAGDDPQVSIEEENQQYEETAIDAVLELAEGFEACRAAQPDSGYARCATSGAPVTTVLDTRSEVMDEDDRQLAKLDLQSSEEGYYIQASALSGVVYRLVRENGTITYECDGTGIDCAAGIWTPERNAAQFEALADV